jgi:hypothetical protein
LAQQKGDFSMKTLLTGIFATMALCGICFAQDATPPPSNNSGPQAEQSTQPNTVTTPAAPSNPAQASASPRIAPGSVIPVQLTKSIDAKKVKNGDEVEARVTQDLKTANGDLLVPKDTKVVGHVTETQVRNKEQKESQLGITFDHAVMKNGGDVPLPMSIQAIIAPPSASPSNNGNGGGASASPTPTPGGGTATGNSSGRTAGMGTGMSQPAAPVPSTTGSEAPTTAQSGANPHQPITGNTQGVVGIPNLTLSPAQDTTQGSVLSSEKNNVKLESGTFLLLRVNP